MQLSGRVNDYCGQTERLDGIDNWLCRDGLKVQHHVNLDHVDIIRQHARTEAQQYLALGLMVELVDAVGDE